MLQFQSGPVTIVRYEQGVDPKTKEPMTWGGQYQGQVVEFVQVSVEGEPELRQFTLDPSLNGARADVGKVVQLQLASHIKQEGRISQRTGRAYVANLRKDRVTAMTAVTGR